jgi:hypothetical protein
MTKTITIMSDQMPTSGMGDTLMTWNCDEYIIAYDRRTRLLTVEEFFGFDDDGVEETEAITDPAQIEAILKKYKPGWPSVEGFTLLLDYYGDRWTIATEPR